MRAYSREYEKFGPWVLEIEIEDDIPPAFSRFRDIIKESLYAFKIPVNVERRNIIRGMPLYKTVIVFAEEKLLLLQQTKSNIDLTEIYYKEILYFQHLNNLLMGEILLGTSDQIHVLDFNPVEMRPVEKGIRIIRKKFLHKKIKIDLDMVEENNDSRSVLYETLLAHEFKKNSIKVVEYQPYMSLEKSNSFQVTEFSHRDRFPLLQDSLYLANENELIIINRGKGIKLPKETDYGYRYTYIPLENILDISLEPDEKIRMVKNLSFILGKVRVVFLVSHDFSPNKLKALISTD